MKAGWAHPRIDKHKPQQCTGNLKLFHFLPTLGSTDVSKRNLWPQNLSARCGVLFALWENSEDVLLNRIEESVPSAGRMRTVSGGRTRHSLYGSY
jgi:hypothetical protein